MARIDTDNHNNRLIIAALLGMVEDEGLTPQESYARMNDVKNQIHFALIEAEQQRKAKQKDR